jgi:predicted glutamine amidotransferase
MKLFACMCNQPQRLAEALGPVRAALVAEPPVSRWGMGYIQGSEALLVRTPKASAQPIDLAAPLFEAQLPGSDCIIVQAVRDVREPALGGTDNTPPFRFRRWMYAQTGQVELSDAAPRLFAHVPEYLRRNLKGRTPAELMFHVFLAMLHDEGSVDDPHLPAQTMRRALASMLKLVGAELAKAGQPDAAIGNVALTNGRAMVCARLSDPLRLRRLWVLDDRGERDAGFRGVIVVSGSGGETTDGFEEVPAKSAVLISRDLQFHLADLSL